MFVLFQQDSCSRVLFQQIQIVYTASFQSFCNKSGSVGQPTNPLNFSVGSILWEPIVWVYIITVTIISQKIKNFLCKQKLVNNCSILSTNAERKITVCCHKHTFTPYPSLSSYSQMDRITDGETNTLAAPGLEELFFQLCCCVSFWFWREIGFGFTYSCIQSTIQLWCCVSFLVLAENSFLCYVRTLCTIQLCSCVSFLVVAGNSSQNENTLLQKNLIVLLYYDPTADVCIL